jgi:proline dehydrogenase
VPPTPKSKKELLRNVNEPRSNVRPTVTPKFGENTSSLAVIPTRELFRAWFVYQLFRFNYIVDRSEMLTKLSRRILGERLFNRVMRATVYGQFVGGESIPELKKVIGSLKEHGIYPVLDYAVEKDIADTEEVSLEKRQRAQDSAANGGKQGHSSPEFKSTKVKAKVIKRASARTHFYSGEEECDRNMESFLLSLKAAAECSVGTTAFVAVKLTALGRPEFLLELAEVLTRTRREFYSISSSTTPSPSSSPLSPPSSPLNPLSTPTHSLSSSLQGTFGQVLTQESLQAWLQKAGTALRPRLRSCTEKWIWMDPDTLTCWIG